MPGNVDRSDVPIVVGFVVVLVLSGGVIAVVADGLVDQARQLGSAGGDSAEAGVTVAENETETSSGSTTESSSASTATQTEPPPETTEADTAGASGSSGDDGSEDDPGNEPATTTETEADSSGSSSGSSGSDGGDGDADSQAETGTPMPTETSTSTPTPTETSTPTESSTYTPDESEREDVDGDPPTNRFDMTASDQWVDWWLEQGAESVILIEDGERIIIEYQSGTFPRGPTHTHLGDVEVNYLLVDAPMEYDPPENFEWEPDPDKSYEYEMSISDGAVRDVLSDDPVVGVGMQWTCPTDTPDCDYEDETAGMVFYVTDEGYAETAPTTIEGQPVEYGTV